MKTSNSQLVKIIFVVALVLISNYSFSQVQNIWRGGTPGMEQEWNCPKNWSNYKVPDEFSDVIVPDVSTSSFAPPIIKQGTVEINALLLEPGTYLTVKKDGQLIVFTTAIGIYSTNLKVYGSLILLDEIGSGAIKASAASKVFSKNQ